MKNSNDAMKVIGALVIGAAAGATLGVLFAPDKGTKTRKKFLNKGKNCINDLKNKFEDLSEDVTKKYENFVSNAKEALATEEK